ncbi:LEA type 2 family protein [Wenzhouxiangella sediminis]|uniref:Late embryogenesis abundant protein LEA-2 subgroup domain-containing protein n=1 Tax=Wenzhouxiangella sediminis TaxID=1792836 RepID=A0A3E1K5Z4_9GAMM|nr:LEA type 2 family protein [Wenzhouxiangella sediminis]RFF29084.1 hypothetical protein DZC52_14615 [Wenzhouxiangella sediminis]
MNNLTPRWPGLVLATFLLAACSGNLREVVGEPPQVSLYGLERHDGSVVIELALRNVNDAPLSLSGTRLKLGLDGEALAEGERRLPLTISARGREVIRFDLPADPAGRQRLEALEKGDVEQLPWTMEVKLQLDGSRDRSTRAEGWLHPVPGQANRFR